MVDPEKMAAIGDLLTQLDNLESSVVLNHTAAYIEAPNGFVPVPESLLDEVFESRKRLERLEYVEVV